MNRLKELIKTNNIVKLSLIILPIVILLLSTTLAYYSWDSDASSNTNIAFDVISDHVYVYYDAGSDITEANLYPTDDKEDGVKKEITVSVDRQIPGASFNLYLDLKTLPNALKHESFKYALYGVNTDGTLFNIGSNGLSTTSTTTISGNFSTTGVSCTTNSTTHYVLLSNVNPTVEEMKYVLYIWIDGVNYTNPDTMMNQSFEFTLHADGINLIEPEVTTISKDPSNANVPNIVDGMIPVYYSFDDGQWHKADKTNTDYNWFNYSERKWANIVLLNSDTARDTYSSATNGTTIDMDDIAAFYVWIPRFKYRTWNINRQPCASSNITTCQAKYSYTAYSTGIEIEFESGTSSTGNVTCTYNPKNTTDPTTLSDTCKVNDTTTITTSTDNTTFTGDNEAWYTHPAFTFGTDNEITGFWVGKFETTGSASSPEIKPNVKALLLQKVSAQFTTSQLFGSSATYGITESGLDAHMLKNLEWGAVAYLSYSDYGMCNGTSCIGMYINNAHNSTTLQTTGRSGGAIAGSPETVATHYPDSGSTSTNKYSDYGYYTYDGKEVAYDGTIGDYASDTTLGTNASTTGNVYGVYDMNGGSYEYVMADMYSIPTGTYFGPIGTSSSGFNGVDYTGATLYSSGNALLATVTSSSITANTDNLKYYDSYSYGTSYYKITAWNRSRLGDATGEVVRGTSSTYAWKPGSGVSGSFSYFVNSSYSWFDRGGGYSGSNSGPFSFSRSSGSADANHSFRSSLS